MIANEVITSVLATVKRMDGLKQGWAGHEKGARGDAGAGKGMEALAEAYSSRSALA